MKRYSKDRWLYYQTRKPSFLKKYGVWIWVSFIFLILSFYLCYWFVYLQNNPEQIEDHEEIISWEETYDDFDDEKYHYVTQDTILEEYVGITPMDVEDHVSFDVNIEEHPDINQVLHTSRLMALEKKKNEEDSESEEVVAKAEISHKAKIAVVIDDMGASPGRTKEIIGIQAPLTASFVTFASQLQKQVELSKKAGHEIMIHVPMEPKSDIFVSEDVLKIEMSEEQIAQAFEKMLKKFDSARGINNHMGSKFTEYADKLAPIMKLLAKNHLFFLDSKTTAQSQGEEVAKKYGVPCLHRHVFLDNENELEYILRQLEKTEKIAQKNGYAVAIGHPKTQTSRALRLWIKTLPDKDVEIVPLSQIVEMTSEEAAQ